MVVSRGVCPKVESRRASEHEPRVRQEKPKTDLSRTCSQKATAHLTSIPPIVSTCLMQNLTFTTDHHKHEALHFWPHLCQQSPCSRTHPSSFCAWVHLLHGKTVRFAWELSWFQLRFLFGASSVLNSTPNWTVFHLTAPSSGCVPSTLQPKRGSTHLYLFGSRLAVTKSVLSCLVLAVFITTMVQNTWEVQNVPLTRRASSKPRYFT